MAIRKNEYFFYCIIFECCHKTKKYLTNLPIELKFKDYDDDFFSMLWTYIEINN